jgi:hypothetical protein
MDDFLCGYCGRKAHTVDHVVPLNRGGTNEDDNLIACCKRCKNAKSNKTLDESGYFITHSKRHTERHIERHTEHHMESHVESHSDVTGIYQNQNQNKNKIKKEEKSMSLRTENDLEWFNELRHNPAYAHIDFAREEGRMDAWLTLPKNKNRKKTRRFILNWLNKIDAPIAGGSMVNRPCEERVRKEGQAFLKPCGEPSVSVMGGRPLCRQHKEYHENRTTPSTA